MQTTKRQAFPQPLIQDEESSLLSQAQIHGSFYCFPTM